MSRLAEQLASADHIVVYPGRGIGCDGCSDRACLFMRCAKCRKVIASCGNHGRPERLRAACCA